MARQPPPRPGLRQYWSGHAAVAGTYDGDVLKRPGLLDVLERLLEVLQLQVDLLLGGLGVADALDLKGLDGLDLARHVVRGRLEGLEAPLDLVDDGRVLERRAVRREVDRRRELRELLHLAAGVVVALLEGLQRCHRLAPEPERRRHLGPVDLEGCLSLRRNKLAHVLGMLLREAIGFNGVVEALKDRLAYTYLGHDELFCVLRIGRDGGRWMFSAVVEARKLRCRCFLSRDLSADPEEPG